VIGLHGLAGAGHVPLAPIAVALSICKATDASLLGNTKWASGGANLSV
jgi:hypothetical protein